MKIAREFLDTLPSKKTTVYVAIVGSRDFKDYAIFKPKVEHLLHQLTEEIVIVSGGAKGTDSMARRYADEKKLTLIEFIPDWETHGKKAGFLRNKDIIQQADICIAFSKDDSPETASSIKLAQDKQIPLRIIKL